MGHVRECGTIKDMRWMIALIILASPVAMAEEDTYLIAFTEGRYGDAASVAKFSSTPDSLAFAARSRLAEAMSASDFIPPSDLIAEAEFLARAALEDDPLHVEARLQLAIALSLQTRPMTRRQAMRTGLGEDAKRLVESVLEDDPANTYAHGFLSVWHIEVRRRGGAIGASVMGASVKTARLHYQAAVTMTPDEASIHWQYARALAALNAKKFRAEIEAALDAAITCDTDSSLEGVMQDRAETLQTALSREKRSAVERLAAKML